MPSLSNWLTTSLSIRSVPYAQHRTVILRRATCQPSLCLTALESLTLKYGSFILRRTGGTCCLASSISIYWRQMLVAVSPHIPICNINGQRPTGEINSIEIYPSMPYSLTYPLLLLGAQKSMLHCSCLLGQHTYTLPTKCRASVWGFRPRAAMSWWQFYSAWSLSFRHMARARNLVPFATQ